MHKPSISARGDIPMVSELVFHPVIACLLTYSSDREYIAYKRQRGVASLFHSKSEDDEDMGDRNG